MKIIERTFNAETGETVDIERNETVAEQKIREQGELEATTELKALEAKKAAREAILDRLGITAEEAKLLLS